MPKDNTASKPVTQAAHRADLTSFIAPYSRCELFPTRVR